MRTVPIPGWVKSLLDEWLKTTCIAEGRIFKRVDKAGKVSDCAISEKAVWHVVRQYAAAVGLGKLAPTIFEGPAHGFATRLAANWSKFNFYSGMFRSKRRSGISAANNASRLR